MGEGLRRQVVACAVAVLSGVVPVSARAQANPPATPAIYRDSGHIVLETRLGGDSAQATTVNLRRGATYRIWVRPTRAQVVLRRLSQDTTAASRAPLDTVGLPSEDSTRTSRMFKVTAREQGEHIVELTNPQVGTTSVRIAIMERAASDTLPTNMRRRLVWTGTVGGGPSYVTLDSGVVYRIVVHDDVVFTPRQIFRAPPFTVTVQLGHASGIPVIPGYTGEYRMDTASQTATSSVQIYEEAVDAADIACIRNPAGPGCRKSKRGLGILLVMISIPIAAFFFLK